MQSWPQRLELDKRDPALQLGRNDVSVKSTNQSHNDLFTWWFRYSSVDDYQLWLPEVRRPAGLGSSFRIPQADLSSDMADTQQHPDGVLVTALGENAPMHVWDAANGALLFSFKANACVPRTLTSLQYQSIKDHTSHSYYLLAAQATRPAVRAWTWGKEAATFTSGLAERLVSLTASPDGALVLGGSVSGKAYLWAAASGRLLAVWQAHYKPISAAHFLSGSTQLVTGGEDANVHVWNTTDVLASTDAAAAAATPQVSMTGHSLAITCIASMHVAGTALLLTGASDRSVKVWHASTGALLTTRTCEAAVTAAVLSPGASTAFVGLASGDILQLPILQLVTQDVPAVQAAKAEGGVASLALPPSGTPSSGLAEGTTLQGHSGAIHSLALHGAGHVLFSASADGDVRFWDVPSGQCVRTVTPNRVSNVTASAAGPGGAGAAIPVTSLLWAPQPPGFPSGVPARNAPPCTALAKFKQPVGTADAAGVEAVAEQGVLMHFPAPAAPHDDFGDVLARGEAAWWAAAGSGGGAAPAGGPGAAAAPAADTAQLQAEVARLQEEVARWQAVNNTLVQRLQSAEAGAPPKRSRGTE